jgi:hypothetical protein
VAICRRFGVNIARQQRSMEPAGDALRQRIENLSGDPERLVP